MTYFGFLAIFLGIPILILSLWTIRDFRRQVWMPSALSLWQPWVALVALCTIAFVYTTPWDNYLVATGVWWYDIDLVTGILLWYVPIEEYTFFIIQPIMTGLLLFTLARYYKVSSVPTDSKSIRMIATMGTSVIWIVSVVFLILSLSSPDWKPYTYLALEVSWGLIPLLIQLSFGADILWRHRRIVLPAIVISTLYLSFADALAIDSGTWTIDPAQSLNIYLGGVLPIEEFIFFFITNTLVVMGLTLALAEESLNRASKIVFLRPIVRLHPAYNN